MRLGLIGLKGHQSVVLNGARELGDVELVAVSDDDAGASMSSSAIRRSGASAKIYRLAASGRARHDGRLLCVRRELPPRRSTARPNQCNIHIVTEKPLTTTLDDLARVAPG